jgi:hypothetical protein
MNDLEEQLLPQKSGSNLNVSEYECNVTSEEEDLTNLRSVTDALIRYSSHQKERRPSQLEFI